jgi:membrane fusion protein, multidrug efflux system
MNRPTSSYLVAALVVASVGWNGCSGSGTARTVDPATQSATPSVAPIAAVEQPIDRFIRVTGTLTAEEQASVAAETAGRVVATPVERGTSIPQGAELIRLSQVETEASLGEAEANAAQIEARLAITGNDAFDADRVAEVASAKANFDLATADFTRIAALLDQHVVSQAEYDQRHTALEAARHQYEAARNAAEQQYHGLQAARARVVLARKSFSDTVIRAPFAGLVGERLVSVGDYVTRGMKVATVVRITPLRLELTIPEQFVSAVTVGQPVRFSVDAYTGRVFEGKVRYVSPALRADQRALTVEAAVPNESEELKPGMFATALVQQPTRTPAVLVPASAVAVNGGAARLYVVLGDRVEERVVTAGQKVDSLIEIVNGLKPGEFVASASVSQLVDGAKVSK